MYGLFRVSNKWEVESDKLSDGRGKVESPLGERVKQVVSETVLSLEQTLCFLSSDIRYGASLTCLWGTHPSNLCCCGISKSLLLLCQLAHVPGFLGQDSGVGAFGCSLSEVRLSSWVIKKDLS